MTNEEILRAAIVITGFSNLELYEIAPQNHNEIIDEIISISKNEVKKELSDKAKVYDIVKQRLAAIKADPKATYKQMSELLNQYFN